MVLTDMALSNFAMTIAASAGAFLAVSAAIWIFLFDRRAQDENQSLLQTRGAAEDMYLFLEANSASPGNYLRGLPAYDDFLSIVSTMIVPYSAEVIPSYLQWRGRTEAITAASLNQSKLIEEAIVQTQKGQKTPALDQDMYRFHSAFVRLMFKLDIAIQDVAWAKGIRRDGTHNAKIVLGLAIFLEIASLAVALGAVTETEYGVSDDWNFFSASMLLTFVVLLTIYLIRTFNINSMSRSEWIQKLINTKAKEMGVKLPTIV